MEVEHAGVPELVEPKAAGFSNLSQVDTQTLVSALHHSMLRAVDLMGVGSNVPVLDHVAEKSSFTSMHLPALCIASMEFSMHLFFSVHKLNWAVWWPSWRASLLCTPVAVCSVRVAVTRRG